MDQGALVPHVASRDALAWVLRPLALVALYGTLRCSGRFTRPGTASGPGTAPETAEVLTGALRRCGVVQHSEAATQHSASWHGPEAPLKPAVPYLVAVPGDDRG